MSAIFERSFLIRTTDVDRAEYCRPSALLGFFQEAATGQADLVGAGRDELLRDFHAVWLLGRVWFRLDRPLLVGETVAVRTWQRTPERLFVYRDYDVLVDGRPVGEGVAAWVVADVESRRMLRPNQVGPIAVAPAPSRVKTMTLKPLRAPGELTPVYQKVVRWSDLDLNGHMNNTRYADVAMDALPDGALEGGFLSELRLDYSRECALGETVTVSAAETEAGFFVIGAGGGERRFDALLTCSGE